VPTDYVTAEGANLGHWLMSQRSMQRAGTLDPSRAARLQAVPGFHFEILEREWDRKFQALEQFAAENGHAKPSLTYEAQDGTRIGNFVRVQHRAFRAGTLSPDRKRRLESLPGFVFDRLTQKWEEKMQLLEAYAAKHGHANLPYTYVAEDGTKLGTFAKRQKTALRQGCMSQERRERLEALPGFVLSRSQVRWDENFSLLEAFYADHGHAAVPQHYVTPGGVKLGNFIKLNRNAYRDGTLPKDREQRLAKLVGALDPTEAPPELLLPGQVSGLFLGKARADRKRREDKEGRRESADS